MRRTLPLSSHLSQSICPKCNNLLSVSSFDSFTRCKKCNGFARNYTCPGIACEFSQEVCLRCGYNFRKSGKTKLREVNLSDDQITNNKKRSIYALISIFFVVFIVIYYYYISTKSDRNEDMDITQVKRLKSYYVSQKDDTWYHIISVLEKKIPSVKSITFLHGEDKKTLNCLTSELVSLYTTNNKIKVEEITFSLTGSEVRDYGYFLEHYHAVVEKFRVLVTDLSKMPGDIARLFHSLCDEESSDIKPSLFIFTLKYDKKTADLKPLERATTILKEAWRDLPQNEVFPLLSRIIKNVVDVVPEQKVDCLF